MVQPSEGKSRMSELPLEPCPWLVYPYGEDEDMEKQLFCSLTQPHKIYYKNIPELSGDSRIVAHCSGWFLVSEGDTYFSLWNPTNSNSKFHLPPLLLKPSQQISGYVLSTTPGDPECKVILFEYVRRSVIFIRPEAADKQWMEIPYAMLIAEKTNDDDDDDDEFLRDCVSCNGILYCSTSRYQLVTMDVDQANHLFIEFLPCQKPTKLETFIVKCRSWLVECCGELLYVYIGFGAMKEELNQVIEVQVFKMDFVRMVWERAENLMGQAVFLDAVGTSFCAANRNGIECDCIYFTLPKDMGLYSFNVKDGCLSVNIPCPTAPTPWCSPMILVPHDVWFSCNHAQEAGEEIGEKEDAIEGIQRGKRRLLDLELDSLMEIANYLNPFDYMNFRSASQICHLIVPKLSRRQVLQRLKILPSSPCLLYPTNDWGAFKFVDLYGSSFSMSLPQSLKGSIVRCSKNGWLLMADGKNSLSFLNPFTEEIIKLSTPPEGCASSFGLAFSSSPTSPECVVVGCSFFRPTAYTMMRFVIATTSTGKQKWRYDCSGYYSTFWLNDGSPVFYEGSFYLLGQEGNLSILQYTEEEVGFWIDWRILDKPPSPSKYCYQNFLLECDGKLMSIFVGYMGMWVQVFSLNFTTQSWERVESLGNNVIYVSRSSCISKEASIRGTENRIYFPRFHGNSILYYSLETKRFHFGGQDNVEGFYNTKEPLLAAWVDPV